LAVPNQITIYKIIGGPIFKNKLREMDNVNKFLALFSEFDMVVTPKKQIKQRALETIKKPEFNVTIDQATIAKADLEKELRRLVQEYKKARKSFKHGKISKQELFDFEWRIFELQEEIRRIDEDAQNSPK
jgi:hypothetical protein|tara:strand:+ start:16 stop:405 length:390 start_codon:yes stop_codon:yes gene_type:complete